MGLLPLNWGLHSGVPYQQPRVQLREKKKIITQECFVLALLRSIHFLLDARTLPCVVARAPGHELQGKAGRRGGVSKRSGTVNAHRVVTFARSATHERVL